GALFGMIAKLAGYGFNKSRSTAYGAIAYQTAYLKAHFPGEFMASLLSCGMESSDRIAEHVDDARRMGIKGLGGAAVAAIVQERQANGPFTSIFDLAERVDAKVLSKGALELLIKA